MDITVREFIVVSGKLAQLGIDSANGLTFLPENLEFADSLHELRQFVETNTVKTLFRINNVAYNELFHDESQPAFIQNNGFQWFGPTIFVAAALISQEPNCIGIALGIIANYLTDTFKGKSAGTVSLNIVREMPDGSCKKISYKGPVDGLKDLAEVVRSAE